MKKVFSRELIDLVAGARLGVWLVVVSVALVFLASNGAVLGDRVPVIIQDKTTLNIDAPSFFHVLIEEIGDVDPIFVKWNGKNPWDAMNMHRARMAISWDSGLMVHVRPRDALDRQRLFAIAYQAAIGIEAEQPWQVLVALSAVGKDDEESEILEIVDFGSPEIESHGVLISGVIALTVAFLPFLLSCSSMAREFEHGTLEGLLLVPGIGWWSIVWGKICAAMFVTVGIFLVILVVAFSYLNVPARLDLVPILVVHVMMMASSSFLGIAASQLARSQFRAYFVSTLYVFCLIFLTGLVFPVASATAIVDSASHLFPLTFVLPQMDRWLIHGIPASVIGSEGRFLAGQCAIYFTIMVLCGIYVRRKI